MKKFAKVAFGALMLAGAATAVAATPADARVSIGIGFGGPVYGAPYPYYASYSCDPYSRWYDPYRCDRGYYSGGYYGPSVVFGGNFCGGWHGGGYRGGNFHGGGFHGGGHHR